MRAGPSRGEKQGERRETKRKKKTAGSELVWEGTPLCICLYDDGTGLVGLNGPILQRCVYYYSYHGHDLEMQAANCHSRLFMTIEKDLTIPDSRRYHTIVLPVI